MSNSITRALVGIVHNLTRLTGRGAERAGDIEKGAARFIKGDVDEKVVHADHRGKREIEQAGEGLQAPETEGAPARHQRHRSGPDSARTSTRSSPCHLRSQPRSATFKLRRSRSRKGSHLYLISRRAENGKSLTAKEKGRFAIMLPAG